MNTWTEPPDYSRRARELDELLRKNPETTGGRPKRARTASQGDSGRSPRPVPSDGVPGVPYVERDASSATFSEDVTP